MPVIPNQDRDQNKVRPSPEKAKHTCRVGARVVTPKGPGVVRDILLTVSEWSDNRLRLMPPMVVVELDEPWSGEIKVTVFLQNCKLPEEGAVFRKPLHDLWPDQVPSKPATTLRPTTEPTVKISQLLRYSHMAAHSRKAQNTIDETSVDHNVPGPGSHAGCGCGAAEKNACPHCGKALKADEKWVCSKCKDEIKGFMGEDFVDPNGPQWYATVMRRMPLVRIFPYR